MRVVLDPGHGGRDSGAVGPNTYEKNNVLLLAQKVAEILRGNGVEVVLTRSDDRDFCPGYFNVDQDLQNRVAVANSSGADIFVSLHNNSGGGRGNEVYALQPGGPGEKLAQCIHARMLGLGMADRGVKFARWYVVRKTMMPAVLVEYGFIDTEEDVILSKMDQAAITIAQGIGEYLGITISTEGAEHEVEYAVLAFGPDDLVGARRVAEKHGNCAIFVRKSDGTAPADVAKAKNLIIVGGGSVGHPNETLLTGPGWPKTMTEVAKYLG